jgi:ankyrin repeat protein
MSHFVQKNKSKTLAGLLSKDNVNSRIQNIEEDEGTLLMIAAELGNTDCVSVLLDAGADVHATDLDGDNVLCWALDNENRTAADIVSLLIQAGTQPLHENNAGDSALDRAKENEVDEKVIELLQPLRRLGCFRC